MDERVVEDEETDRRRGEPEAGELPETGRRGRAMTPGATGGERNGGGRAIVRHARHRLSGAPRRHPEIAVGKPRERAVVVARFYGRQPNRYVSRMDRSGS